jgi:ubiquitin-protein ligase
MQEEEFKNCFYKEKQDGTGLNESGIIEVNPDCSLHHLYPSHPSQDSLYDSPSNQSNSYSPPEECKESVSPIIQLAEASNEDPIPPESQQTYFQKLKNYRLTTYNMWNNTHQKYSHYLGPQFTTPLDTFAPRITKEMKVLARDLPCEDGGSIFVTFDDNRMDLIKALLMGPVDTPYAYGFYQFHISLPGKYPQVPPKVRITTTGEGTVRFNPNLYDDGYVCLSVINTWDGDPEEMWNPNHSNLFQVLLSIQSLVMDKLVIQKEPGYETYADDSLENRAYSQVVKYNNVKWAMLEMLRNPPVEFRKVIRLHFSMLKDKILETIEDWLREDDNSVIWSNSIDSLVTSHNNQTYSIFLTSSYKAELSNLYQQLQAELNSLPTPEEIELEEIYYQEPKDFPPSNFNYEDENEMEVEDSESGSSMSCDSKNSYGDESCGSSESSYSSMEEEEKCMKKKNIPNKNTFPYTIATFSQFKLTSHNLLNSSSYSFTPFIAINMTNNTRMELEAERLLANLTCQPESCIFIVQDQGMKSAMRALISGGLDSPYAYGLYLFDILCPENYPLVPPLFKIKSAQGYEKLNPCFGEDGSVDLNYKDWRWNPDTSDLQEVLYHIKYQIMNYKITENSLQQDTLATTAYRNIIRYNNVKYGMLELIRNPPLEFKDAIRKYFVVNRGKICKMLDLWQQDAEEGMIRYTSVHPIINTHNSLTAQLFDTSGYSLCLSNVVFQLEDELAKLFIEEEQAQESKKLEESAEDMRVEMEEENPLMYLDVEPMYEQQNDLDMSLAGMEAIMSNSTQPVLLRSASSSDPSPPESTSKYYTILNPIKINTLPFGVEINHKLASSLGSSDMTPQKAARFSKELSVISKHLPCEAEGSAFVIIDENRMDLMQALISGTLETPYAHGLYLFDIAFPSSYPQDPPKMNIRTTGNGAVRFNPNLYSDGYICLSIINTWGGNPEEMWNPSHSNLLQVLLSIQSLVMDDEVINKEPGYEAIHKTSDLNQSYCNIVKYNNMKYAMLETIKHPPKGFEEVIIRHFSLKRQEIMTTVEAWLDESRDCTIDWGSLDYLVEEHNYTTCELFRTKGYSQSLEEVATELRGVLDNLPEF